MPPNRDVGRVSVRVMPNLSRFRTELRGALEELERRLVITLPTQIDLEQARRMAGDARRVIQGELNDVRTIVNVTADGADIRTANRQLDAAARDRTAQIEADVDQASLSRARQSLDRLGSALGGLGRAGGRAIGLAGAAGALSTLAAGAAASVVPVLQLGAALAPVTGVLATVPAFAAGAGAAMGTLAIAFSGVGDALGAALSGDVEVLNEALEGLAPSAASVVREVSAMRPQLQGLRESLQGAFFAPLVGGVTELGERLLPTLSEGLTGVGAELGAIAAELVDFAGQSETVAALSGLFDSVGTAIRDAGGALPDFLAGLREIGVAGLPYLESAGPALAILGDRFREWATAAAESGQVTAWIEGALDTLSQLGDLAGNVGGIISSIFQGAGDGGLLDFLVEATGRFNDFLNSAEGSAALEGIFAGLGDIGEALGPVIEAILSGLGELAPVVGRIATAFGPVLTSAIEGLVPALVALEPGLTAIIDGLGQGIDALVESGALEMLATALSDILVALSPLLPVLGQLAAVLVGALAEALIALSPGLAELATTLAETLSPILPELAASFSELVVALAPLIPPLVEALLPVLELLPPIVENLASQMSTWASTIEDLTPIIIGLLGWLETLIGWIVDLAAWWINLGTTFSEWSGRMSQRLRDALREMIDRLTNLRDSGSELLADLRDRAVSAFTDLRDRSLSLARNLRDGIVDFVTGAHDRAVAIAQALASGITGQIKRAVDEVRRLPQRIRNFFAGAGSWLTSAGRNVINGLIDGIRRAVGRLWDEMGDIAQGVRDYWPFSPARRGPLRTHPMDRAGRNIADMLAEGIASGERVVARATEGLAGAVARPSAAAVARLSRRPDDERRVQPVVQVTNHYPQAEPTSVSTNRTCSTRPRWGWCEVSEYPHYSVDGVPLNDGIGRWFLDGDAFQVPPLPGARGVQVTVPGVHGTLPIAGLDLESVVLGGQLVVTDATAGGTAGGARQLQDNLAAVYMLLGNRGRVLDLRYHLDEATVRQADALMVAAAVPELVSTTTARLPLALEVPGALWRDVHTTTWGPTPVPALTVATEVDTLTGSTGPVTDALIRVTGTVDQPSVTDVGTGGTLTYGGSLTGSERMLVDCARMRAAVVTTDTWDLETGTDVPGTCRPPGRGPHRGGCTWPSDHRRRPRDPAVRVTATAASNSGATLEIRGRRAYL
ncbi:hypothetical protein BJF83_17285 [Nocardiopsis sp. CNR-923]|uniref:hypothetical protein n=1 Tax=Nocardiopsis sp. CNR-923 TaxID=1904965 RepID=UPI000965777A|nr:hypothetical protein [Nocardiopsis sp. CNR-923]OLT27740.1 hypothetical protein BJF83_17285 [Nocardiopsis sp. CNR-923]